jgi:hypothetical protein
LTSGPAPTTNVYDYATDTTTVNGMPIKVTYPGLGLVFHDVGTITFDGQGNPLTIHGPPRHHRARPRRVLQRVPRDRERTVGRSFGGEGPSVSRTLLAAHQSASSARFLDPQ